MGRRLDLAIGILNGAIGDHLHATDNGLAIEMSVVRGAPGRRVAIFLHGLMCTEDVWALPDGSDYGSLLARDLGYAPLYVRFNTGRAVADSGADLARLLEELVSAEPDVEEIVLVGFSMGGLVIRSSMQIAAEAGHRWLALVRRAFYLGTPHLGSPWERAGRAIVELLRGFDDPYARLAGELGDLRSLGIKDLGDPQLALLPSIEHHFVAGFVDARIAAELGDALVPLASGTNGVCGHAGAVPPAHVKIMPGLAHMTLAHHPDVYAHIRAWCEAEAA